MVVISDEHYVAFHAPDNAPAAHAADGELVVFKTRDCYNRSVTREDIPYLEQVGDNPDNPSTGPLYIDGAEPGDALAVDILDIQVADHGLVAVSCGPFADAEAKGKFRILPIRDGKVEFRGLSIPVDPMIGVIATAPADRRVPCLSAFENGGNMDSRLNRKGATVWLPVTVPGALLAIGDLHATMGDGEVIGTGLEVDGEVTVRVRLLKNFKLNWAVTETKDAWYVNSCADDCDEAIRNGYFELRRLIANAYGLSLPDAAIYMSLRGYLECNQACLIPHDTFRVGTPKLPDKRPLIG